jgi:hypothetical protein
MKSLFSILFFISFQFLSVHLHSSSQVSCQQTSEFEVYKLSSLCKVWGFMKYYHPKISKGKLDWDKELVKMIPIVMNCSTQSVFNVTIDKWVSKYCKSSKNKPLDFSTMCHLSSSLKIDTNFVRSETVLKLKNSINLKKMGNYYCDNLNPAKVPRFYNEKNYSHVYDSNDLNYRLLGLFRFWNVIHYYYPYVNLLTVDWDLLLNDYITRIISASTNTEYFKILREMALQLEDGHVYFDYSEGVKYYYNNRAKAGIKEIAQTEVFYPAFRTSYIEEMLVVSELFIDTLFSNVLKLGDVILKMDGKLVVDMVENKKGLFFTSYSNYAYFNHVTYGSLVSSLSNRMVVEIKRNESIIIDTISLYPKAVTQKFWRIPPKEKSWHYIDTNIVYYNPSSSDKFSFWEMLSKTDYKEYGFVVDLRLYPEFVVDSISKYFYAREMCFANSIFALYPGCFRVGKICRASNSDFQGKIVIIVNSNTLSRGEFTAMVFQAIPNVTTIGSQTAGFDGSITWLPMPGGSSISFTGQGIEYPDGQASQKSGVKIDVHVTPTIDGIKSNRDELLEKAIELMKNE